MDKIQTPGVPSFYDDIEAILPDGWKEGDDIFAESEAKDDDLFADGQEDKDLAALLEKEDANGEQTAPTKDESAPEATTEVEAKPETTEPDGAKPEPAKPSRTLTLKVNHKEETVDVNAMSDDDLIALLQKGRAFDAMKESENKATYRRIYQEQVDAGMTEAAARLIAQNEAGGKSYALTDEEEPTQDAPAESTPADGSASSRDLRAELGQLNALLGLMGQPKLEKMPDEVALAVADGIPLPMAYLAYQQNKSNKAAASLQKENKVLKQNAASAARAPVKGVTGGDSSPERGADIYSKSFDAGANW